MHNKINNQNCKVLDLVLKRRWWNLIASGDKSEEYRLVKRYWILRLINKEYHRSFVSDDIVTDFMAWYNFTKLDHNVIFRDYNVVCFRLGYTNIKMSFKIESIKVKHSEFCNTTWGAEPDEFYFVIKLGERIS